jgi:malonyl CoA-acyl carrier protein transacylase
MRRADRILGYSVAEVCARGGPALNQTELTQPAVFVVNKLLYEETLQRDGIEPDCVFGHSLGEINAIHAAGMLDFDDALRLVKKRAELMAKRNGSGMMAALVGDRDALVSEILRADLPVYLASDNSPRQIVVAGSHDAIRAFGERLERSQLAQMYPLAVSGPFHSPLMRDVDAELGEHLWTYTFKQPRIPVISNYAAQPYRLNDTTSFLARQLTHTVRWFDCIRYVAAMGPVLFRELGPKPVLSSLIEECLGSLLSSNPPPSTDQVSVKIHAKQ